MASKVFSGVVRCSQRQSIIPLKVSLTFELYTRYRIADVCFQNRFVALAKKTPLPPRRDPSYAESLRILHSAILGICALIESLPYSVEPWMPSLTEGLISSAWRNFFFWKKKKVLAPHATDPPPISTTIRNCASEFKKVSNYSPASRNIEWNLTSPPVSDAPGNEKRNYKIFYQSCLPTFRIHGTKISSCLTKTSYKAFPPCSSGHHTVSYQTSIHQEHPLILTIRRLNLVHIMIAHIKHTFLTPGWWVNNFNFEPVWSPNYYQTPYFWWKCGW